VSGNLRGARDVDPVIDGTGLRVALVCARFNDMIVERLERGAYRACVEHGVASDDVEVVRVAGALEIPQAAMAAARTGRFDAIVALGTVIRGDTYHFEVVADASASGLMQVALGTGVAIGNGILTVDTDQQALDRAPDGPGNKGAEAALAALEVALLQR
jgi:6,7-dimethyl-8-ribityllumazine synthase